MRQSKFFTNVAGNTLFEKFKGIAEGMAANFYAFQAVVGYFRSSGYFRLRKELVAAEKIQILVGIDVDALYLKSDKTKLFLPTHEEVLKMYEGDFLKEVREAGYSAEVEEGILTMCKDIRDGRLEIRIHPSKNLHAKFYLCLPRAFGPNTDGWVIMGSSNLSASGLGLDGNSRRYELNVAMKDYDDVKFCQDEFERLWGEGEVLSAEAMEAARRQTHLGQEVKPYEIFMRALIYVFGEQVEDDFTLSLPKGYMDLRYQNDAVIQGHQLLLKYNGFFLADVVGLGKTVVAAMIAKRFIEANGRNTNIIVVHPPAVGMSWKETFQAFGIGKRAQFVTSGSIEKVLNGEGNYRAKEEFDLVIVDESHNFRNASNNKFDSLQRLCKAPRMTPGRVSGQKKKVMLISATALNNGPSDLLNQILLFQDAQQCTIDGVADLNDFFAPIIDEYKEIMGERLKLEPCEYLKRVDALSARVQHGVLEKVTVRRTRQNILNDKIYSADLARQGIVFPKILPPNELTYVMDAETDKLFWATLEELTGKLNYARYRAIEFLTPQYKKKYPNAKQTASILAGVYRTHMVKRLESSFAAFRKSVETFYRNTKKMLELMDEDRVLILPDLDVSNLMDRGLDVDEIIQYALEHREYEDEKEFTYPAAAFYGEFRELLEADCAMLLQMMRQWKKIEDDPKLKLFVEMCKGEFFDCGKNPTGKVVVFSESVATLEYLREELGARLKREDILLVTSKNRNGLQQTIRACFDANWEEPSEEYNILLTSDVLAEGINLHRANIIINYDSPWNATRLMQRIGRVNRIGSKAAAIYNYMFYPSKQGNAAIGLYQNSLMKLQTFHSTLGEDSQIYSHEEMLRTFQLYDPKVKDEVDESIRFLRMLREFREKDRVNYERIKRLPEKSRVLRAGTEAVKGETLAVIRSDRRTAYYRVKDGEAKAVSLIEALRVLEAKASEKAVGWTREGMAAHYADVGRACEVFQVKKVPVPMTATSGAAGRDKNFMMTQKFLRTCRRWVKEGRLPKLPESVVDAFEAVLVTGAYTRFKNNFVKAIRPYYGLETPDENAAAHITNTFKNLGEKYLPESMVPASAWAGGEERAWSDTPHILLSESFTE